MKIRAVKPLRQMVRRFKNLFMPRALVLLYHRVTELQSDPQLLCVSRQHFAEHLEVLRSYGEAMQIKALDQALLRVGRCAIGITFDDGYADNLYHARPLLERHDIPATVFVATGYVGGSKEFWHDDLEKLFLQPGRLPAELRLDVNGVLHRWQLGEAGCCYNGDTAQRHSEWSVLRKDNPTLRHELYRTIFGLLLPLPDEQRRSIMDGLLSWASLPSSARPSHRVLSAEEIVRLADGELVEVGSHTVWHPVLAALSNARQMQEISQSRSQLENILGRLVTSFAYPYGTRNDYTEATVAAVRAAGFKFACSNFAGMVQCHTDRWQLPRYLVRDWDGEEFARNLHGWINA